MSAERGARVYRAEAVVLRRLSLGETDRVVTLFTRERGKLGAVAKGARGPRSRLAGATEPFTHFHALLSAGQSLDVLTQAQVDNAFPEIRRDLARIGYASYFLEIVDAGVEERQPAPAMWDLLVAALTTLERAGVPELLARAFELHAMSLLGFEPETARCVADGAALTGRAAFHPLRGGVLCLRCARSAPGHVPIGAEALAALRFLPQQPLARAAAASLSAEARRHLAQCLIPYVRHHLEAPLRALSYLDALP